MKRATVLVGFPEQADGRRYNAMAVIRDGRVQHVYRKACLPELHGLRRGSLFFARRRAVRVRRRRRALRPHHLRGCLVFRAGGAGEGRRRADPAGAQRLAVPHPAAGLAPRASGSAGTRVRHPRGVRQSRRRPGRARIRWRIVHRRCGQCTGPAAPAWHEAVAIANFDGAAPRHVRGALDPALEPHVYAALVMGVRDYVGKNRFPACCLGCPAAWTPR